MSPARELFRDEAAVSWGVDEPVSDLRFVEANAIQQAKGLIGWVYGTYDGVPLDGLRVLRTDDGGRYVAQFSNGGGECTGPGGVEIERSDHDLILKQVLGELRRRGVLR